VKLADDKPTTRIECVRAIPANFPRDRATKKSSIEVSSEAVLAASSSFGTQRLQG
jgi:hypothetical protein